MSEALSGKGLVLFYSATGNTRQVAEALARALEFDIEAIQEPTARVLSVPPQGLRGFLDFMRAGFEGFAGRRVPLLPLQRDPARYPLVLVGTPVWAGNPSSPARTFLAQHGARLSQAAFFWTGGDDNNPKVVPTMAAVSGRPALASLGATADQVQKGQFMAQVEALAQELARLR